MSDVVGVQRVKLNKYLEKIEQNKPINLDRFIELLPYSELYEWRKIYSAVRVRDGHLLSIEDMGRHKSHYIEEALDRPNSALLGCSHDFASSFSHILVLNRYSHQRIPFAVVSTSDGFVTAGQFVGKKAVLIENIENFYRYKEFLQAIGHSELIESGDILFGSGNQICHHLNHSFLTQYSVLYCAQDVELGGLTIYKTLKKSLPQSQWLAPVDWLKFKSGFCLKPKKAENLTKAIALARELDLHIEADLMNQTRAFFEQEAFLPNYQQD
ncbi:hypothetical protein AB4383_14980 [Vibrio breoganii]|uniref:hypothetical protein n=1 Tax=Vibrio breoganii TaxID=553239 RepID=UPI001F52F213|nr:hypothetical protein [Vibrio breoganii]